MPSLQESFGISIVEAMAASKPVIISKNIAIANSVKKAFAGIICEDNIEDYSSALEKLLISNTLQKEMGNNGKNLQRNIFDWKIISKQLESAYIEQINECKSNLKF
jgi:glycosyltransferase involved in cell wall biosynthesis